MHACTNKFSMHLQSRAILLLLVCFLHVVRTPVEEEVSTRRAVTHCPPSPVVASRRSSVALVDCHRLHGPRHALLCCPRAACRPLIACEPPTLPRPRRPSVTAPGPLPLAASLRLRSHLRLRALLPTLPSSHRCSHSACPPCGRKKRPNPRRSLAAADAAAAASSHSRRARCTPSSTARRKPPSVGIILTCPSVMHRR